MLGFDSAHDPEPLGYVGGRPVHTPTALAILHAAMLVLGVLLVAFGAGAVLENMAFGTATAFGKGWVWQILTYPFVHFVRDPWQIIWLAVELMMLARFGREIEKVLGRKFFLGLYLALVLVVPLVLGLMSLRMGPLAFGEGSGILHFCVFLAFAMIYPRVPVNVFFATVEVRWIAGLLFGAVVLFCLANQRFVVLALYLSSAAVTWAALRLNGVGEGWALMDNLRRRAETRAAARRAATAPVARPVKTRPASFRSAEATGGGGALDDSREDVLDSVDPLLDKIAQHGLASLTQSERATLERARHALLRRGERK